MTTLSLRHRRIPGAQILTYLLLTVGAIVMVMPFFWMLSTSVKVDSEIFSLPPRWLPSQFDWANYSDAYFSIHMGRLYRNTMFVTTAVVVSEIMLSSMAGYAFARLQFPGRNLLFFSLLITMMVPFEVMLLPIFLLARQFPLIGGNNVLGQGGTGMLNTYSGLIFPNMISVYGVFLFRQFFLGFPVEIEDAARIDGSSRTRFFWTILLPNARPVIGTMGLFAFLWTWNDFLWPLVIIKDSAMNTLQIGIASFNQEFETRWAELMAASVMATLPVIILFLLLQRFLVKGVATSGIKG